MNKKYSLTCLVIFQWFYSMKMVRFVYKICIRRSDDDKSAGGYVPLVSRFWGRICTYFWPCNRIHTYNGPDMVAYKVVAKLYIDWYLWLVILITAKLWSPSKMLIWRIKLLLTVFGLTWVLNLYFCTKNKNKTISIFN